MASSHHSSVKRLNATLPEPLAQFVAQMTGDGGLYETPSEFVRDLIRRYMENMQKNTLLEQQRLNSLLRQSIADDNYTPMTAADIASVRQLLK